ncbi:patatin-like phospholipase family protein [Ralstonia sp. 21MJYT02-10]|nr:patatin-like phospholipase family protein [Ralstonia mojiangensis]
MAFHAGVFQALAERRALEGIAKLSTVSGGSLFMGLLGRLTGWRWPTSDQYLNTVLPAVRDTLTSVCLERHTARLLLRPWAWRHIFSRANLLAMSLEECWGINVPVDAISGFEREWSINGTTAETGRRFRFKHDRCGDYELGYAAATEFPLSLALASSAAYPFIIGPVAIAMENFTWTKRPKWGGDTFDEVAIAPAFRRIHVMDGGIYDNLGTEPLFDAGRQVLKDGVDELIVSDAGAPLTREGLAAQLSIKRARRAVEIALDQTRALRVRSFINSLQRGAIKGRYYGIGSEPSRRRILSGPVAEGSQWLSSDQIDIAARWPTDLKMLSYDAFDLICRHGCEVVKKTEMLVNKKEEVGYGSKSIS